MYSLSAFFYGEIYIWSRSPASDLTFFKEEALSERVRLNERPFYLRFLFITLGVGQGVIHIWKDYDLVRINVKDQQAQKDPKVDLWNSLVPLASKAGLRTIGTFFIGNVIYFLGARSWLWSWYFSFWKVFSSIGKKSTPSGLPPFLNLIFMFASQGTLLVLLWQFTNKAFNLYMAQEPLNKIGKPITSDAKDPNGSLLNGLKSKKDDNKVCGRRFLPKRIELISL
jgi:nucleoporin NDC1